MKALRQSDFWENSPLLNLSVLFGHSVGWMRPTHIGWGQSALLSLGIQMLFSSKTPKDPCRHIQNIFNQIFGHPVAQSRWHIKLIITVNKLTLKCILKSIGPWKAKMILAKMNQMGKIILPDIKAYYIALLMRTKWYWQKDKHMNQQNIIDNPEMDLHKYVQLIFSKGTKEIQWRKNSLLTKWG